jgi:heme A synthase
MNLHEFKEIFYMEWGHRVLGRIIGVGFVLPLAYFAVRKRLTATMPKQLFGMALLLGAQGALGWYMVKSGLEDSLMDTPGAVPRVSQYRLAAHLGTAFVLYAGMFATGIATLMDWRFAKTGEWAGLKGNEEAWKSVVNNPLVKKFARNSKALTVLVFLTALSGEAVFFSRVYSYVSHSSAIQEHLWQVLMPVFFTTNSRSWADVWHRRRTNCSHRHTRRTLMALIPGGATSLKTLPPYNLTIAAW